ncbi:Heme oxygenase 1 [Sciurus carolinensis]|uniref:Heme oxygenase 1 n=1 Tax=Sciurus carolinensis TaxID=30640 RepID=A0AA41N3Y9_SCICA|nr:Heme oxygenase 1 [Sciurus carolinensis]
MALHLPSSSEGLAFFIFPHITSATKFKQLYCSHMNPQEKTPEVRQRVIKEAKTVFLLHIQLFEELQELLMKDPEDQSPLQALGLHHHASSWVHSSTSAETPGGKPLINSFSQALLIQWVLTVQLSGGQGCQGFYAL